jgi:hypothetical protein
MVSGMRRPDCINLSLASFRDPHVGDLDAGVHAVHHLGTGIWLFYLLFADILNAVLKFTLFI